MSSSGGLGGDLPHPRALCPFEKFEPLGQDLALWQVVKVSAAEQRGKKSQGLLREAYGRNLALTLAYVPCIDHIRSTLYVPCTYHIRARSAPSRSLRRSGRTPSFGSRSR